MAQLVQPTGGNAPAATDDMAPHEFGARVKWIKDKKMAAQRFAVASKRTGCVPDLDDDKLSKQLAKTTLLLDHLGEDDTQMSPLLNRAAGIEAWLGMFNDPAFHFPDDTKQRAQMLLQRFQGENWGAPAAAVVNNSSNSDSAEEAASPTTPAATSATAATSAPGNATATVRNPPANHRIWGRDGIMRGILPKVSGGIVRSRSIDPDYDRRRSAKVLGDNGLAAGDWFPYRLCALRDGAHGESQAGISGVDDGAWSIVVAGAYEGVDEDRGDVIWYSAPGSADNENRNEAQTTSGTGWLQRSLATRNPVRVLRAANKKSAYAPSCGIRYDGLYVVVAQDTSHNDKGGLFIRYLLERLPNQKPLKDVMLDSPTAQQMADFTLAKDLW
ncbi:hypothetical protein INS49_010209 [Diaporthe citri]|uniref:uncharacterized protein n=1 Tax=Diaporthe citri TaxID=83186 RepID=UPI001C8057BD|nr:uncharacterized protein INS49_010209 [Diaporthe citri]KAG6361980.1 hypothetical protein INS49_010209 [Diaporthe citri]